MGEFIIGIVMDVLGHVGVQHREGGGERWIPASVWFFFILNAREFVVLYPEVSLQNLGSGCEAKQGCISSVKTTVMFIMVVMIMIMVIMVSG